MEPWRKPWSWRRNPAWGGTLPGCWAARDRGAGCLIGEQYVVTWAIGHLVSLCEPDELDAKYKRWSYQTLPMLPETIPLKVLSATRDQYKIVAGLMNGAATSTASSALRTPGGRAS